MGQILETQCITSGSGKTLWEWGSMPGDLNVTRYSFAGRRPRDWMLWGLGDGTEPVTDPLAPCGTWSVVQTSEGKTSTRQEVGVDLVARGHLQDL